MHLFSPLSAIACAVVLLSACTETTAVAPAARPLPGMPIAASMTQLAAASHPNSEKYRDSGFRPATGSSGSATVSVRALLDKAGTTDVEVTTGTFDEASAPGSLDMVQVKAFAPSGTLAFTDNHTGLSGATASFSYGTLPHGTPLQVQSVVDGGDPRADVVTLATAVASRAFARAISTPTITSRARPSPRSSRATLPRTASRPGRSRTVPGGIASRRSPPGTARSRRGIRSTRVRGRRSSPASTDSSRGCSTTPRRSRSAAR